jgi:hypothetical protein
MGRLWFICISCSAIACGFASIASADDWLMFRKDSARAAASTDKVTLPLKPLWSWKGQRVGGFPVVSTVAIRDGSIFFFAGPQPDAKKDPKAELKAQRLLVCADAKTGTVRWTQAMSSGRMHPYISEDIGPAVSASGIVYALDTGTLSCPEGGYTLRAFSAAKGKELGQVGVPIRNGLSRFFLRDGHGEENFLLHSTEKPDC